MIETLDHEKFEGVKELAEISTKISAGTAALSALKDSEEKYLAEREQTLVARLQATLVASQDLIKDIGSNHDALIGYRNDLTAFHDSILSLIKGVDDCTTLITDAATELEGRIATHEQEVASFKETCLRERVQIEGERGELSQWRDRLGSTQRLLDDRSAMLQRAIERTKK